METTLLAARLLLAAIFLLAGVSKLVDHQASSRAFDGFGLPAVLARPFSVLLPLAEILVSFALVPVAFAWYGACGALALLSVFILGIGVTLLRGLKPACRCFGQLSSAPIGWPTLARNIALAALAGWLVSRGPLRVGPALWAHLMAAGGIELRVFFVAACLLGWLFVHALRRNDNSDADNASTESELAWDSFADDSPRQTTGPMPATDRELTPQISFPESFAATGVGLPVGTPAPDFDLPGITGRRSSLQSLRAEGKTIALVFSSPHCEPCRKLLPNISRWISEHGEALNIVIISRGTAADNLAKLRDVDASRVILQQNFEIAEVYQCSSTPTAVLVGADGRILSSLAEGALAIRQLISSTVKPPAASTDAEPQTIEESRG